MWILASFLAGVLAGILIGLLLLLRWAVPYLERFYVFRPARDIFKTPESFGVPFEQCFIETADGCRLSAWHLRPDDPVGSVIYFHGNGGNLGILNELLIVMYQYQLEVLALDYRGYGWSSGIPSESGVYQDALATVDYFRKNFYDSSRPLIYWGRSLGSCIASYAASQKAPHGLVLESGFPSKTSLLEDFPHLRPFRWFSRYKLETARYLTAHDYPVLLIHGDQDRTIPFRQGRRLYEQLPQPKEFFCVKGAGHLDLHARAGENYMQRILGFVHSVRPATVH